MQKSMKVLIYENYSKTAAPIYMIIVQFHC